MFDGEFGWAQNWATMESAEIWQSNKLRTPFEQADMQKRIDASKKLHSQQRQESQRKAASKAVLIISQSTLQTHPYLEKKGFPKMRWDVYQDALVVPMYIAGCICGCQLINGEKKFLYGQRTNDAYFQIGNGKREFIVEGFASGLSLQAILAVLKVPATIYITFSAGNALRVAKAHPDAFFCADHDESGVGQRAAEASGCKWWMPEQVGWDVNDLHVAKGLFAASQILRKNLL